MGARVRRYCRTGLNSGAQSMGRLEHRRCTVWVWRHSLGLGTCRLLRSSYRVSVYRSNKQSDRNDSEQREGGQKRRKNTKEESDRRYGATAPRTRTWYPHGKEAQTTRKSKTRLFFLFPPLPYYFMGFLTWRPCSSNLSHGVFLAMQRRSQSTEKKQLGVFFFFVSLVLFLFQSKTASEFQPRGFFTFQLLFARRGYRIRRAWSFTVQESERASALGQGFDQIILLC